MLGERPLVAEPGLLLAGLDYDPQARNVDIFLGGMNPHKLTHLVHSVNVPRAVYLIEDKEAEHPVIGVQIQGAPNTPMTYILFSDANPKENVRQWTAEVAYSLFEMRGEVHGGDQEDWYEAETLIRKISSRFTE